MISQTILFSMTEKIVTQFHPNQIILFGSLARGAEQEDSDIDLLVVMSEAPDKRKTAIQIRRALAQFLVPKDIVVTTPEEISKFSAIKGSFLRSALREGKVLYVEAKRWLQYAREDLQAAELILQHPTITHRHVCWLAQQCAKKAIKAALIFMKTDFRRTHDLHILLKLLPSDWDIHKKFVDLAELTQWAVESRYLAIGNQPMPRMRKSLLDKPKMFWKISCWH